MINIPAETKQIFLTDSSPKELIIETPSEHNLWSYNLYKGTMSNWGATITVPASGGFYDLPVDNSPTFIYDATDKFNCNYVRYRKYAILNVRIHIYNIITSPTTLTIKAVYNRTTGAYNITKNFTVSQAEGEGNYVNVTILLDCNNSSGELESISRFSVVNNSTTKFEGGFYIDNYQLRMTDVATDKDEINSLVGIGTKDISREVIPVDKITNDNLVTESFSLTESLCSQDNIKFGLCEAAHCEFTVADLDFNFKDLVIKPKLSCATKQDYIYINWCSGQNPTQHSDIWNNASMSSDHWKTSQISLNIEKQRYDGYIPKENNIYVMSFDFKIDELTMPSGTDEPYYVRLGAYLIDSSENRVAWWTDKGDSYFKVSDLNNGFVHVVIYIIGAERYNITGADGTYIRYYNSDKQRYTSGTITKIKFTWKNVQFNAIPYENYPLPEYDEANNYPYSNTLTSHFSDMEIPLGVFTVTEVKTQYTQDICKKTITAYDSILKLQNNAADWYSSYMWCLSTDEFEESRYNSVEYVRQIYSAFWNYSVAMGLDSRSNYTETVLASWEYFNDIKPNYLVNEHIHWNNSINPNIERIQLCALSVNNVDTTKRYVVDFYNPEGDPDDEWVNYYKELRDYYDYDILGRGIGKVGSVCIEQTLSTGGVSKILVDKGDYFTLDPRCISFKIHILTREVYADGTSPGYPLLRMIDSVTVSRVEDPINLVNSYQRLMYYKWWQSFDKDESIFPCDSSVTGRDIVHSLLETTGCFFRLNRYTGTPEFIYCTKSGLYPSNTLYPADNLYPRAGTNEVLGMGRYISLEREDYEVKDFGKIQFIKDARSNDIKSICEYEHIGNVNKGNTYIIDDNIFYCNDVMEYDYENTPTIAELAENMYNIISNLGYVPNTTKAVGMPWLECGDRVGLLTKHGGVETFVFRRTLTGIQSLKDTYESAGDEYIEAVNNFGYKLYNPEE